MTITVHHITRYTVQILTRRVGEEARSSISVRLYDDENVNRGIAVFESYGPDLPPKPIGDYATKSATAFLDIAHFESYMDVLRLENPVYLKISWTQQGRIRAVSQVSIDTKKEVIGEFFVKPATSRRKR